MEPWQTFVVQSGALGALVIFMRAQVRQQARLFDWFTAKMNGSLDRLSDAVDENTNIIRELKDEKLGPLVEVTNENTKATRELKDKIRG